MSIGLNIKKARANANMTQHDLAKKSDIQVTVISRYETDSQVPSLEKAKKLADAMNVTVNDLLD